jgi:hypothetical protein
MQMALLALRSSERASLRRFPVAVRGPIRAGEHDGVAVGVTKPDFPVVWSAIALGRIAVARKDNFRAEFLHPGRGGIEVFDFEPQQHPIAMSQVRIPNRPVMMFNVPLVQLHEQLPVGNQLFVLGSAVAALAPEQPLVPAAAGFNIANAN